MYNAVNDLKWHFNNWKKCYDHIRYSTKKVYSYTRKVEVLSLPETIKEKMTFGAKALRWELVVTPDEGHSLETSIFSFIEVYSYNRYDHIPCSVSKFSRVFKE